MCNSVRFMVPIIILVYDSPHYDYSMTYLNPNLLPKAPNPKPLYCISPPEELEPWDAQGGRRVVIHKEQKLKARSDLRKVRWRSEVYGCVEIFCRLWLKMCENGWGSVLAALVVI